MSEIIGNEDRKGFLTMKLKKMVFIDYVLRSKAKMSRFFFILNAKFKRISKDSMVTLPFLLYFSYIFLNFLYDNFFVKIAS